MGSEPTTLDTPHLRGASPRREKCVYLEIGRCLVGDREALHHGKEPALEGSPDQGEVNTCKNRFLSLPFSYEVHLSGASGVERESLELVQSTGLTAGPAPKGDFRQFNKGRLRGFPVTRKGVVLA